MSVELKGCEVKAEYKYKPREDGYGSTEKDYYLTVVVPLPGGKATYNFEISQKQYESLEFAVKLAEKA